MHELHELRTRHKDAHRPLRTSPGFLWDPISDGAINLFNGETSPKSFIALARRELKVLRIVNARLIKVIIGDKRVEVHTGTIAEAQLVKTPAVCQLFHDYERV